MGFKEFVSEKAFPSEVTPNVDDLILRINDLSKQIDKENDSTLRSKLTSQKNKLLSYITVLGIRVKIDHKGFLKNVN